MKKLLFVLCLLFAVCCKPKGPYIPQNWWDEEDTIYVSEYDRSIIDRIDTATTIDEIFPPEWYPEEGPSYDEVFNQDSI